MAKELDLDRIMNFSDELKFDTRLSEKKVEHGFLTSQQVQEFINTLPEETEYEFTSLAEVGAEAASENTAT